MSKRSVYCLAPSRARAEHIVTELKKAAFPHTDVSVLFLEQLPGEPATKSARSAALRSPFKVHGPLGWVADLGRTYVAGLDPLVGGGPIAVALRATPSRPLAGGLIDFGAPAAEAKRFEEKIKAGQFLVAAHSINPEKSDDARALFTAAGAESVFTIMEVKTPKIARFTNHGLARSRVA